MFWFGLIHRLISWFSTISSQPSSGTASYASIIRGISGAGSAISSSSSIISSTVGTYAGCVRGKRIILGSSDGPRLPQWFRLPCSAESRSHEIALVQAACALILQFCAKGMWRIGGKIQFQGIGSAGLRRRARCCCTRETTSCRQASSIAGIAAWRRPGSASHGKMRERRRPRRR